MIWLSGMAAMGPHDRVREQLAGATSQAYLAAFRLLGAADQARDACQEAAARALAACEQYDPSQPFYPWFYRILKNHCIDRIRQRGRTVDTEIDHLPIDATAERDLSEGRRAKAVGAAVAALPDDLREVIELRHFQDLSYEEMAAALDVPVGTVMSRLYRARKTMRQGLLNNPAFDRQGDE